MTCILHKNALGEAIKPEIRLPSRRRRLSGIVAKHADKSRPFIVSVHRVGDTALAPTDDTIVLRREMKDVLVGPKDVVIVTLLPQGSMGGGAKGGGGGAKQIGMAVAAIALMVVAPYAVSFLGPAFAGTAGVTSSLTLLGNLTATGITVGALALMSMANKPKANKGEEEERPLYGVSGGGNLPRPGDRVPRGYGRFWTTPDLAQPDFSVYNGEDQILHKRMVLGLGKYQIHTIRVGNQVLWREGVGVRSPFDGTQVEFVAPGTTSDLVPKSVATCPQVQGQELPRPGSVLGTWSGPFVVSAPGVEINKIQVDVVAPQGSIMTYTNSQGAQEAACPIGWEFQYAPVNTAGNVTGSWVQLDVLDTAIMSKRPLRYSRFKSVPLGQYAVRGRHLYADKGSVPRITGVTNTLVWEALRGYVPDNQVRPDATEVCLKIKSNAALGVTSFAEIQVEATGMVPVWNGSTWTTQATRKAVWAYADIMRNATYGAGLPTSSIDLDTLLYYANAITKYDTFDGVIRGPDSVWNVASTVLMPMRAEPVQLGRVWSLVRDDEKTTRRHVITPMQIVRGTTGLAFDTDADNGDAHLIVEYDEKADPKRIVQLPEVYYGNKSSTPTRRKLFGVSSYDHAHNLAKWMASSAFYRRQTVKFTTEHDGRIYKRGDSIAVESWFSGQAQVAKVIGRTGDLLTFDRDVVATGNSVILRDRSGREWGPVGIASQNTSDSVYLNATSRAQAEASSGLTLSSVLAIGLDTMEETTALVAPVTYLRRNYIVKQARPTGRDRITVEAVIDDSRVWTIVGGADMSPPYGDVPDADVLPPSNLTASEIVYLDSGDLRSKVRLAWTKSTDPQALVYEVQFAIVGSNLWQAGGSTSGTTIDLEDMPAAVYNFRVRAVYSAMNVSKWVQLSSVNILGTLIPPPDVAGVDVAVMDGLATLSWPRVDSILLSHYEVRYSTLMTGATWSSAIPVATKVTTESVVTPARVGTYLVKAISPKGVYSANAISTSSDVAAIEAMNAVQALDDDPGFPGQRVNVISKTSAPQGIQLDYVSDIFARADWFDTNVDWYLGTEGVVEEGTYYMEAPTSIYASETTTGWSATNGTLSAGSYASPVSGLTACRFLETTATGLHYAALTDTLPTTAQLLTRSVFVQAVGGRRKFRLQVLASPGTDGAYADFDLVDKTATTTAVGAGSSISAQLIEHDEGWFQLVLTLKPTATHSTALWTHLYVLNDAGSSSYAGSTSAGFYWWQPGLDLGDRLQTFLGTKCVDLGAVYTSRLTAVLEAFGDDLTKDFFASEDVFDPEDFFQTSPPSTWSTYLEYRYTSDDPASQLASWTDWKTLVIGDVTARAIQFRLRLQSLQFGVTPVVTRLEALVDMPDRLTRGNNLSVPAAGLAVAFDPPYMALQGLGISAQGLATGDYYTITSKTEAGFTIRFFNSANVGVARTFDYVAVGYGRRG